MNAQPEWRKSSRSSDTTACVEVGQAPSVVSVRDSKHPSPVLTFASPTWATFLGKVAPPVE